MTAQQVIDHLSQYPPDTPVMVDGYEGGYEDVEQGSFQMTYVKMNGTSPPRPHYGPHWYAYGDTENSALVLVISRASD